ncbi:MAG: nuclear transport factor 2 family protein [Leptolyngbya sp. SIO1D8]|nr:nuclear transport factor 2 family protein [Leptolyngbya sp. SIO1D8]
MSLTHVQINRPEDVQLFQQLLADWCQAWCTLPGQDQPNWEAIRSLYANTEGLTFYDAVTPHSFSNVDEMQAAFPPVAQLKLIPQNDLRVYRTGDSVWTTITQDIEAIGKDGYPFHMTQRQTAIWQFQNDLWVVVHEHLSSKSSLV